MHFEIRLGFFKFSKTPRIGFEWHPFFTARVVGEQWRNKGFRGQQKGKQWVLIVESGVRQCSYFPVTQAPFLAQSCISCLCILKNGVKFISIHCKESFTESQGGGTLYMHIRWVGPRNIQATKNISLA